MRFSDFRGTPAKIAEVWSVVDRERRRDPCKLAVNRCSFCAAKNTIPARRRKDPIAIASIPMVLWIATIVLLTPLSLLPQPPKSTFHFVTIPPIDRSISSRRILETRQSSQGTGVVYEGKADWEIYIEMVEYILNKAHRNFIESSYPIMKFEFAWCQAYPNFTFTEF